MSGQRRRGPPKRAPKHIFRRGSTPRPRTTTVPPKVAGKKREYSRAKNTSDIEDNISKKSGKNSINVSKNDSQCLWKIDGFEIVNTNKGVRLKAYLEDETGKKKPYPLIDISKWDIKSEIRWDEIFRSNVKVLITEQWVEEVFMDSLRLSKDNTVIDIRFYFDNRLIFYLECI